MNVLRKDSDGVSIVRARYDTIARDQTNCGFQADDSGVAGRVEDGACRCQRRKYFVLA